MNPLVIEAAAEVRALVLTGYGLNCEAETCAALQTIGARVTARHVADAIADADALAGHQLVVFIGGFSFGDHIASGRVFANRLRYRMGERLLRHVDDGGLVLGICNGFQTIVKLGLLPGLEPGLKPRVSLVMNDRLGYWDAWVRLAVDRDSPCVFTRDLPPTIELPSRHGEGKLVFEEGPLRQVLEDRHLVPVRYADEAGAATERWPDNPDGSPGGIAGLCDPSGRVFGLMPHPEAYMYPENHPHWIAQREAGTLPEHGLGLHLLAGGVRAIASR
ncbi:phosphoribosylformylglycinamidine synthase subunit PurQ [Nannocystis punicea]|uniref:Phosphoribosylformylglycinamidine synthase subunit PurQ n=1 Tax=Nannocystis punicea TaxID=2995304 RepID=A0ABY7HAR1_9BACT|nr:phosphoribosylformylglycinamidine synthase subunit PurQ [Nannocystis poenicansa]WAS96175.1 phosphoribosylformylglycinamidine synthase subunit PurQ [Nannocystis poenicansa]